MFEGIITKVLTMNMTSMYNFCFFLSLFFSFFSFVWSTTPYPKLCGVLVEV